MISILIGVLSLILIGTGLLYFLATTVFGMIEGQRLRRREAALGPPGIRPGTRSRPTAVYFLIPCLNEEGVIGTTLSRLLANEEARVVVIDDNSDDRTADVVRSVGGDRTLLITRRFPNARKGKGPALNAGLPAVRADAAARGLDADQVLVAVMDADGYLSEGALAHVLPLFDDPTVGGAQLGVRISNREVNLLTTMQDFEFWGLAATAQLGRARLGTVSLGGNGQFTRLSALESLSGAPWSSALTEDLDLALRLLRRGWRLTTTAQAAVYQEGVTTVKSLIRQRTRWYQGHMACIKQLRRMWGSPALSNLAVLEVSAYLLIPWVFILPWSILFHIGLWELFGRLSNASGSTLGGGGVLVGIITLVAWYLLGFGPSIFGGYLYYRQDRSVGKVRALVLGHALLLCNYVAFLSCWLAALRSLRGLTGWEKTVRRSEGTFEHLIPADLRNASRRLTGRLRKPSQVPAAVARSGAPTGTVARPPQAAVASVAAVPSYPLAVWSVQPQVSDVVPMSPAPVLAAVGAPARDAADEAAGTPPVASLIGGPPQVSASRSGGPSSKAPVVVRVRVAPRGSAGAAPMPVKVKQSATRPVSSRDLRLPVAPRARVREPAPARPAPVPTFDNVEPTALSPALTGRLQLARRVNVERIPELGARFLIPNDVMDMVSAFEEENA
ncbi:MAG TPA: glycosyltransferase [Acidimicrobiales bacterium]|jgi:cellulose synthase/poly-beta-1,6-N-acetylglucosamine synthase-like glycosyltransferase|nr:glycosyltransferase [Acidimicrobiales bacterium]